MLPLTAATCSRIAVKRTTRFAELIRRVTPNSRKLVDAILKCDCPYWGRCTCPAVREVLKERNEIRREFAPYIGVNWSQKFGQTADYARDEGEGTSDVQFVAGIRAWF